MKRLSSDLDFAFRARFIFVEVKLLVSSVMMSLSIVKLLFSLMFAYYMIA